MKILSIEKLTNTKWLNLFTVKFEDKTGKVQAWDVVSRNDLNAETFGQRQKPNAVVVVGYHVEKKKIVVIKEFRLPLGNDEISFPAGLIDKGETIEDAAIREFKEETGLTVTKIVKVSPPIYSSGGMTDESVVMVYVECEGEPSSCMCESTEDIKVLLLGMSEVEDLLHDPNVYIGAKCWFILDFFENDGWVY